MKKIIILLCAVAVISPGCGKKEVIQPSRESVLATQAITAIEAIKEAYEEKNRNVLRKNMEALLAENTIQNLSFDKAELDLTARMVKIGNESVEVNLTWHGLWWIDGAEKIKNRGVADLVFDQKTMKLMRIEGDSPFLIPVSGMRKIKEQ